MKFYIILVLLMLSACNYVEPEFIKIKECPEKYFSAINEFIQSCRISKNSVKHCREEAQELYCTDNFIKNPNAKPPEAKKDT